MEFIVSAIGLSLGPAQTMLSWLSGNINVHPHDLAIYGRFGEQLPGPSHDYDDLQRALGRSVPNAGAKIVLNRHLLLNMWRPLRLLERVRTDRINPFQLTDYGLELAHTTEPRRVLESVLRDMRFVHAEWSRPKVTASYTGISRSIHIEFLKPS